MRNIAAQGGGIAHLRTADQPGCVEQGLGMLVHQRRSDDLVERQRRADKQTVLVEAPAGTFPGFG